MNLLSDLALGIAVSILAMVVIAIVGIISAIPVYFLWNWLMPEIFGLKVITFWQAWGIAFLLGMLFKSHSSSSKSSSQK